MKQLKKIYILFLILGSTLMSFAQGSKTVADSLIAKLATVTEDTTRINLLNEIAHEYCIDSKEKSEKYAKEALSLAEKKNFNPGIINSNINLGLSSYYTNDYEQALKQYNIAKKIALETNNQPRLAAVLNNIGLVYDDKAEYKNALEYYLRALTIVENDEKNKRLKAGLLNNIGLIFKNMGRYDNALDYYTRSMKIKEELGNKAGVGSSLHNIAMIYKIKKQYDKSLEYNEKALAIRKEMNDLPGTALTLNNIGSVYESMGEYEKAYPYFKQALDIRRTQKDKYNLAINLFSMGSNYCNRHSYAEGIKYFDEAMNIAKKINAKDLIKNGYEVYADYYATQKNYEKAFEYQKLLVALKDSILSSDSNKQLGELQARYESEKKEKEIELLTKDGEIQSLQLNKNKLWLIILFSSVLLALALAVLLYNRYKIKQKANWLLEHQNVEITQQKKEITDSINYAKRIQESILPPTEHWNKLLPASFIFYRPKDIVSGDFYWIEQKGNKICFAAVDCTGHGVPGALMSVIGFNLLTQAVNEVGLTKPSDILKHLDAGVTKTLRQSEEGKGVKDGMDLSLCTLDMETHELQYSGAFNSLYYVTDGKFNEIKADKFPIGVNIDSKVDDYRNHTIQLKKGDCLYLFSDGYADQFGGPQGKKFKYNQLKQMLTGFTGMPLDEQLQAIEKTFDTWKGGLEQIDDVVIIGVKI